MKPTIEEMVAAVQAHAIANFEAGKGWDYISECWGKAEIAEEVKNCRTISGAIKKMGEEAAFYAERESEGKAMCGYHY